MEIKYDRLDEQEDEISRLIDRLYRLHAELETRNNTGHRPHDSSRGLLAGIW